MFRRSFFLAFSFLLFLFSLSACGFLTGPKNATQAELSLTLYNCPQSAMFLSDCLPVQKNDSLLITRSNFYFWLIKWSANDLHYLYFQASYEKTGDICPPVWSDEESKCFFKSWSGPYPKGRGTDFIYLVLADTVSRAYEYVWQVRDDFDVKSRVLAADTSNYYVHFNNAVSASR